MTEATDRALVDAIPAIAPMFSRLSAREREVAVLLAVGEKNADIAVQLAISIKTVDTHRGHILKKLECRNNVDLARLAIREGQVQP